MIIDEIIKYGGVPYYVGGCVRDRILGLTPKDIDVEVFNLTHQQLEAIVGKNPVGESFSTFKADGMDFSLPRRERSTGAGHTDFDVNVDPYMTIEEALLRRDFTINSMAMTVDGVLIDPYGGKNDLLGGLLKHTSAAFIEDHLRVLRGMRFCSRFNLIAHPSTVDLCRTLSPAHLSTERVFGEFNKWALTAHPAAGLHFITDVWIDHFPWLKDMSGCPQDPTWHPEGDVLAHTILVCKETALIAAREQFDEEETATLLWAALLHDVGKPATTVKSKKDRWTSPNHAEVGSKIADEVLEGLKAPTKLVKDVSALVKCHMDYIQPSARAARRLIHQKKPRLKLLFALMEADKMGRGGEKKFDDLNQLKQYVQDETYSKPHISGNDLLSLGYSGIDLGNEHRRLYELQVRHGWSRERLLKEMRK